MGKSCPLRFSAGHVLLYALTVCVPFRLVSGAGCEFRFYRILIIAF